MGTNIKYMLVNFFFGLSKTKIFLSLLQILAAIAISWIICPILLGEGLKTK